MLGVVEALGGTTVEGVGGITEGDALGTGGTFLPFEEEGLVTGFLALGYRQSKVKH